MAIAGFVLAFFCGLLGIIFSAIGLSQINNSKGTLKGKGLAIAGLVISIVTMVVGVLAAIAIPAFSAYMNKSKTVEAQLQLNRMSKDAKMIYAETSAFPDGAADLTPAQSCCAQPGHRCAPDPTAWAAWEALDFQIDDVSRFQYRFTSTPTRFEGQAVGDLDCDGTTVTYRVVVESENGMPKTTFYQPTNPD